MRIILGTLLIGEVYYLVFGAFSYYLIDAQPASIPMVPPVLRIPVLTTVGALI